MIKYILFLSFFINILFANYLEKEEYNIDYLEKENSHIFKDSFEKEDKQFDLFTIIPQIRIHKSFINGKYNKDEEAEFNNNIINLQSKTKIDYQLRIENNIFWIPNIKYWTEEHEGNALSLQPTLLDGHNILPNEFPSSITVKNEYKGTSIYKDLYINENIFFHLGYNKFKYKNTISIINNESNESIENSTTLISKKDGRSITYGIGANLIPEQKIKIGLYISKLNKSNEKYLKHDFDISGLIYGTNIEVGINLYHIQNKQKINKFNINEKSFGMGFYLAYHFFNY